MLSPSQLLPEFFALLGIDLFLVLSLLTCLLDTRFPKAIPYIYQAAALTGFGHLLISRDYLAVFGEYTRFWYCFFYLVIALGNIIALNVYLAVIKGLYNLAKVWSGAVAFPSILVSIFFVFQYSQIQAATFSLVSEIGLLVFTSVMGFSITILFNRKVAGKLFRRNREVR